MFKGKSIFNASFDAYANNYHSARPGYPAQLFRDIRVQTGVGKRSRLLEIGAGSGIATAELAKMGCRVVAIEPGANLAAIAKKQTKKSKNVEIIQGTFEDYRSTARFDAVLAFTAFHWLTEGDKYHQILELLNDTGSLVLVWNSFFQSDSQVTKEVNKAYTEFLPEAYPEESVIAKVNEGVLSKLNRREQEVVQNPLFNPVFLRKYLVFHEYDDKSYPMLLNTYPKIVEVNEQKRSRFLAYVAKVVKKHGRISVPVLTTLIICNQRESFLKSVANPKGRG